MPTERAMKAAEAVTEAKCLPHWVSTPAEIAHVANLIDRATGLPELEAREEELKRQLATAQHIAFDLQMERDALAMGVEELAEEKAKAQAGWEACHRDRADLIWKHRAERDALAKRLEAVVDYAAEWSGITGDDPNAQVIRPLASAVLRLARGEEE